MSSMEHVKFVVVGDGTVGKTPIIPVGTKPDLVEKKLIIDDTQDSHHLLKCHSQAKEIGIANKQAFGVQLENVFEEMIQAVLFPDANIPLKKQCSIL